MPRDELTERIVKGEQSAFEELVDAYGKKVYSTAFRILGDRERAEDAAQEVFIKVYNSIGSFKGESSLSTWIYRITVNLCLDIRRREGKAHIISLTGEDGAPAIDIADERESPHAAYENTELRAELERAIALLSPEHRAVVVLRDIHGLSYGEVAAALSCAEGTMKSRLNRAREKLRDILSSGGNFLPLPQSKDVKGGGGR